MDKSKILSTEEVNALLNASQEKEMDLSKLITRHHSAETANSFSQKALANVAELTWSECEKLLASFLRKKVLVHIKETSFGKLAECLEDKADKHAFSVFQLMPNNFYSLVVIGFPLLHQIINVLYGGLVNSQETIAESPGKVSSIVAEKLAEIIMEGFSSASKEYGSVTSEIIKTVTIPNLISKLSMEEEMCSMTYTITLGEHESVFHLLIPIGFLHKFIPASIIVDADQTTKHHSWRHSIEHQVIDSDVTLIASLPEIKMQAKDLAALKSGDLIPIGDPTVVDVWLNNLRLFRAAAGQANANRIVKIIGEN